MLRTFVFIFQKLFLCELIKDKVIIQILNFKKSNEVIKSFENSDEFTKFVFKLVKMIY